MRSRTKNVSINMVIALMCQTINLLTNFICRTVFIKTLGADYLGVNGLFTNVIMILSFAELGIGNAIIFSMYKPLALDDKDKLTALMKLYKKAYTVIGLAVAIIGIFLIPFIRFLVIKPPIINESLELLYLLFLFNTVISYFFVYKKSIIIADQKNYIILMITEGIHIFQIVIQIVILYITHNFVLYLITQIICTLVLNVISSVIADRMYPFLNNDAKPLRIDETKRIFKNVKALAIYKFGSVILNGTDNLFVSAMIGISNVGLVSNYVLLNTSCNAILNKLTEAFTASIGNLNAIGNKNQKYEVFNKIFFITAWLYGFASIGLMTISSSFIECWIGKEYLLDNLTVAAIILGFYVQGVHYAAYTYRTTLGLFVQGKYSPLLSAIINIVLSYLLCKYLGLAGIFIATPISRIFTTGIVDPVLIYKNIFLKSPILYYIKYVSYTLVFIIAGAICQWSINFISIKGWIGVIIKVLDVTLIFNIITVIFFYKTKVFKDITKNVKFLLFNK